MQESIVLKILNANTHSELFIGNTEEQLKKEFKQFALVSHPDRGGNTDLMKKLNELYSDALKSIGVHKIKAFENEMEVVSLSGKCKVYKFKEQLDFELGKMLIGENHVTYLVEKQHKRFYDNAISKIKGIKYPTTELKEINSKFIPTIKDNFESKDYYVLQISKTKDVHRLGLVKDFIGKFDIKHTAWVTTRLSNILCVLEYNNIVHNGINLDNCFISPEFHSVMLIGGWWYCTNRNEKMIGTVSDVLNVMDLDTRTNKISTNKTDLDSIKEIGRKLNGGSMVYIDSNKDLLPKAISDWFNKASEISSVDEYEKWEKALTDGFGKRNFIKFDISEKDMYTRRN